MRHKTDLQFYLIPKYDYLPGEILFVSLFFWCCIAANLERLGHDLQLQLDMFTTTFGLHALLNWVKTT